MSNPKNQQNQPEKDVMKGFIVPNSIESVKTLFAGKEVKVPQKIKESDKEYYHLIETTLKIANGDARYTTVKRCHCVNTYNKLKKSFKPKQELRDRVIFTAVLHDPTL